MGAAGCTQAGRQATICTPAMRAATRARTHAKHTGMRIRTQRARERAHTKAYTSVTFSREHRTYLLYP